MSKKIKKSRVLWLSKGYGADFIRLHNLRHGHVYSFCSNEFRRYFPLNLKPGDCFKVKITIEVIE